jgi:hypothetical protein
VSRVLFRAGDLIPTSPSGSPRSEPHAPAQHQTAGTGGNTLLHPKSPSPSETLSPSGASEPPAKHQAAEDRVGTASPPNVNKLQKAADNSEHPEAACDHQPLPQEAAVSEPASSSNDDVTTRPSMRDEVVTADSSSSEVETRSGGTKRAASRSPSQPEDEEAVNNNSVAGGDLSVQSPNKRVCLNEATTTTSTAPPAPSSIRPEESPAPSTGGLFPSVPLCIDAGALTGRIWCPVNMRNEPDPHWKEFPRNWSHPVSFFLRSSIHPHQ